MSDPQSSNVQLSYVQRFASVAILGVCLSLAGCTERELILKGEREPILRDAPVLDAEIQAAGEGAGLPDMVLNADAGHPGITSNHTGGHLQLELPLTPQWSTTIARPDETIISLPQPVIAADMVFALGADAQLHGFDTEQGKLVWQTQIDDENRNIYPGRAGGIAAQNNHLAAHASRLEMSMLDADTGEIRWQVTHQAPLQAGPTFIGDEAVLVSDIEGQLYAYAVADGELLWENAGLPISTVIFGAAYPAVYNDEVVIAGSGGEISVHRAEDASLIWAETLASFNPRTPLEELSDILAHPIHDGQQVIVASQAGRLAAFDAMTGLANWEQPIATTVMPWLAGETLFVVSVTGDLYALRSSDGALRWRVALEDAVDDRLKAGDDLPHYLSPFVGAGQVHILSQKGRLYSFNADTGEETDEISLRGEMRTAPQIANGAVYVLAQNGKLTKLQ